jgi:hypothetical protein
MRSLEETMAKLKLVSWCHAELPAFSARNFCFILHIFLRCSLLIVSTLLSVYSGCSIVTKLCDCHYCLIPEYFHLSIPISTYFTFPSTYPLTTTHLLLVCINLSILAIPCKWNPTLCGFCVRLLLLNMMFSRHVVAWSSTSFLFIVEWYSTMWACNLIFL